MRAKKSRVGKILSYLCGLLILTASFLGAFWLPEYYSRWQDECCSDKYKWKTAVMPVCRRKKTIA